MKFNLFKALYDEALEETTLEYYIAERGWEDWMGDYDAQEVADILTSIYTLANSPLKDSRSASRAEFGRTYDVPLRTLENWDSEDRTPPSYVKLLLDFAQFNN
ncbi:hypothetical protein [Streptococcus jiangjianxini]|uniref:hypothetical protein n=1 Tax=Streptococcus jiangjianxini TaxID=3161189 RepID=UPI0032EE17DA